MLGTAFLELLDQVIDGNCDEGNEIATQIKQRISQLQRGQAEDENDLSHITHSLDEGNPLQDKSGKHEAMLFLSHLQPSQNKQSKET